MYSNDFSVFALFTAGLATLASAYHKPVGNPKGNPIYHPGLNEIVHKGEPFHVTWKPTTPGTVTILLLRGPSDNLHVLHPIAHKIPNDGHFTWHVGDGLQVDKTHYGLQLIDDKTGQYQYSTQFGIGKIQHSERDLFLDSVDSPASPSVSPSYTVPSQHSTTVMPTYSTPPWMHGNYTMSGNHTTVHSNHTTTHHSSSHKTTHHSTTIHKTTHHTSPTQHLPTMHAPSASSSAFAVPVVEMVSPTLLGFLGFVVAFFGL